MAIDCTVDGPRVSTLLVTCSRSTVAARVGDLRAQRSALDMIVFVGDNRERAQVHKLIPEGLVHITRDGNRLHIFCRRRPLMIALAHLKHLSPSTYGILSDFFRRRAAALQVVWPATAPPHPRAPRHARTARRANERPRFECDECDAEARVVNWREVYLCQACFDALPDDNEMAGWKWEDVDDLF